MNAHTPRTMVPSCFPRRSSFFWSGVSSSSDCTILAMLPNWVSIPVEVTTALPRPWSTVQPENTMLSRSESSVSEGSTSMAFLLTGSDSPVREASLVLRLAASRSLASAEMRSPVESMITSPGTSSRDGTLFSSPSRITFALGAAMSRRACMVFSAR
ncbi:MAG: hypothetical protein A4E30_00518 [Methanomassiliicoccales archaeon PtaB.Bin215]|nr:MAG: hypothetical protein A4E30_00518 [Methanomassiliicoccales archaeon PtaB.Bin215]